MADSVFTDGDLVRTSAAFTNSAGEAADPTTVTFVYKFSRAASATTLVFGTDAAVVKDSTGNYHVDVDATGKGGQICYTRFVGTGAVQRAIQGRFRVKGKNPA